MAADQYAIIGVAKLKSGGNIRGVLDHMERNRKTANANGRPNDVLIQPPPLPDIMERIKSYFPRKNAVYCYDFLMTMSPGAAKNMTEEQIKTWEQDSLAWCRETFGRDNVIGAICHRDETTPHIQALIIPEKDGKLNARAYTGGREKLRGLWTSYAQAMSKYGLKRGKLHSPAEHQDIKEYYSRVNNAGRRAELSKVRPEQLPQPKLADHAKPQEYAAALINKALEWYRKENAALREELEAEKNQRKEVTEQVISYRETYSLLKKNPDAFRELAAELEQERQGRAADKEKYLNLITAIKTFFRKNISRNSVTRKPESLGNLLNFPELRKDIELDLTGNQKNIVKKIERV